MPIVHRSAAILSIGDELILGQTLDTNARWLAARVLDLGIIPRVLLTVPDDLAQQTAALRGLAAEADLILVSGGLGPTADDLTRQALAAAADDDLVEDADALAQIRSWFAARGRAMPPINRVQALRPSRGSILENAHGTAPGLAAAVGDADAFCLPGPPNELIPMFTSAVAPRLRPPPGRPVRTRALHCFGIGESDLAQRLGPLMARDRNPLVGTTASKGVVSARLRYEGPLPPDQAESLLDQTERQVRDAAGPFLFGRDDETLPSVVLARLRERAHTLAVVESCTGGLLAATLTRTSGSSASFLGGFLTYSNALKSSLAKVPPELIAQHGAVSRPVAAAMAAGGLSTGATHALAVTGVAGPDGGSDAKPVGTVWIALASADAPTDARRFTITGDRDTIREWSVRAALAVLFQRVAGLPPTRLLRQAEPV